MNNHKDVFQYQEYEISNKEIVAPKTVLFQIKGKLKFRPGQFVQAALDRYGEATFAPCSDPKNQKSFDLCIRGCGIATSQMTKLLPGDKIKIRGPYGNGWPVHKIIEKEVVLIAGGMGIVPLMPLLYEISRHKSEFSSISLLSGFRTPGHVLFSEELQKFAKAFQVKVVVEHTDKDFWGEKGMITDPLSKLKLNPKKTEVLICGPDIMWSFCEKMLVEKGIDLKNIYVSFERRMECGSGLCQHCNIGKYLVCKDGPIFSLAQIKPEIGK